MAKQTPAKKTRETIPVKLSTEVSSLLGQTPAEASACLAKLALIELFRRGEISSGYAAEVLAIPRWDFIMLLGQHGVGYLDASEDDLRQQVEAAEPRRHRPGNSSSPTPVP